MLPDMSSILEEWSVPIIKRVVVLTYDSELNPTPQITDTTINAVIQTPNPEILRANNLDTSLRYILAHTISEIDVGDYLVYQTIQYKIVSLGNWINAGYYRAIAEEVKGDLV